MSSQDEFFDGMKGQVDPQEWVDSAEFFINIRRRPEPPPPEEQEKTAGFGDAAKAFGRTAFETIKRNDPTKVLEGATSSKAHALAALTGAALFAGGTMLLNRGKKELGGKSQIEHDLSKKVDEQNKQPEEGLSFERKALRHITSFGVDLARLSRQHPVRAGMMAAIPGAKSGLMLLNKLHGKGK